MGGKKHNHIVAEFHQKNFMDHEGKVSFFDLKTGVSKNVSPKDSMTGTHFYSLREFIDTGVDVKNSAVEDALGDEIEGPGATAINAAIGGQWPLSKSSRRDLAVYVLTQLMRGKNVRDLVNYSYRMVVCEYLKKLGYEYLSNFLNEVSSEVITSEELHILWESINNNGFLSVSATPATHIWYMLEQINDKRNIDALMRRPWAICNFDSSLIMGDNPVVWMPPDEDFDNESTLATARDVMHHLGHRSELLLGDDHAPLQGLTPLKNITVSFNDLDKLNRDYNSRITAGKRRSKRTASDFVMKTPSIDKGIIAMPINRTQALVMGARISHAPDARNAARGMMDNHISGDGEMREYLNILSAVHATRALVRHPEDVDAIPQNLPLRAFDAEKNFDFVIKIERPREDK